MFTVSKYSFIPFLCFPCSRCFFLSDFFYRCFFLSLLLFFCLFSLYILPFFLFLDRECMLPHFRETGSDADSRRNRRCSRPRNQRHGFCDGKWFSTLITNLSVIIASGIQWRDVLGMFSISWKRKSVWFLMREVRISIKKTEFWD